MEKINRGGDEGVLGRLDHITYSKGVSFLGESGILILSKKKRGILCSLKQDGLNCLT